MKHRAIFLDRDGVLNQAIVQNGKPYAPSSITEVVIPSDAKAALQKMKAAGFLLIGATNQPDVARGTTARETVESINALIMAELPIDEIFVCFHDDVDHCHCRKPLPGLLTEAAAKYDIDLKNSIMVGDRWKDIEAGKNAGCKTIFIAHNYAEKKPTSAPDFIATTLTEVAQWVINI